MEHIKLHEPINFTFDAEHIERLRVAMENKITRNQNEITKPIYQQLYFKQRDWYNLFSQLIRFGLMVDDNSYFHRAMPCLDLAIETSTVLMHGVMNDSGSDKVVEYNGQMLSLPFMPLNKRIMWVNWSDYLCQAIFRRDKSAVDILMQFTPEKAMQVTDEPEQYTAFYVRFLKGLLDVNADHSVLIDEMEREHKKHFSLRFLKALEPFYYLAKEDRAGFETSIIHSSKMHRTHVKKVRNNMTHSPLAFYPPQLNAAASLAFDRHGWRLEHQNDYLPEWLIYNEF
ncbi:immunity 49 family protein [Shewanella sp. WXL01]|uniref:immunity 49 family protein n=1 Tax=Shewanella sp. WXL01 TaxID=2709721 RepID=UPI001438649E|nr:immunity 49 family protein [Shewanella sp. WXL01]NKF49302.1 immunity 49 family protein [Shewanella sp. WXL01]